MTIIELMVAIAIVAILAALGLPSFASLIVTNRAAARANSFVGDLQYARSEAIKRGVTVVVCASTDGVTCPAGGAWQGGWIVFSDDNANGSYDIGTDTLLRKQAGWGGADTFTASGNISAISFNRDGFALGLAGPVTWRLSAGSTRARVCRNVTLNIVGHQSVSTC